MRFIMATEAQKLISVSLAKIAASRCLRGGISLHKNLLVATVLQKARYTFMEEAFRIVHGHRINNANDKFKWNREQHKEGLSRENNVCDDEKNESCNDSELEICTSAIPNKILNYDDSNRKNGTTKDNCNINNSIDRFIKKKSSETENKSKFISDKCVHKTEPSYDKCEQKPINIYGRKRPLNEDSTVGSVEKHIDASTSKQMRITEDVLISSNEGHNRKCNDSIDACENSSSFNELDLADEDDNVRKSMASVVSANTFEPSSTKINRKRKLPESTASVDCITSLVNIFNIHNSSQGAFSSNHQRPSTENCGCSLQQRQIAMIV